MRSPPPMSRSSTLTTPQIAWPASCSASIALIVEPPVLTTSSTTRQRSSGVEQRPFDAARQAVRLDLLAHEEDLHVGAAGERRAGDRVGAHRHPADRRRAPRARLLGDELAERREARRPQDRALGVDVVRRGRAAGQRHLADDQRVRSKLFGQSSRCAHRRAYLRAVLERPLRIVAIVLSLIIAAGFCHVRRRRVQPRVQRAAQRARRASSRPTPRRPASATARSATARRASTSTTPTTSCSSRSPASLTSGGRWVQRARADVPRPAPLRLPARLPRPLHARARLSRPTSAAARSTRRPACRCASS